MLFYLTVAYLLLEFGRPQDLVPVLSLLHLPGLVSALLLLALILSGRVELSDKQTRLFALLLLLMALHVPLARNNYVALQAAKYMLMTFVAYLALATSVDTLGKLRTFVTLWLGILTLLYRRNIVLKV